MINFLKNIVTARNNVDYSLTKLLGIAGGVTMIFKFMQTSTPDFQGFGAGIALLMAALAAKFVAEGTEDKTK